MILSITGPSGIGKTTLMHNIIKAHPEAKPLTSYTTRAARPSDEPGEYVYVSDKEFDDILTRGEFLWEAQTTNHRYGTRRVDIDAALADGFFIPILVIEAAEKLFNYIQARGKTNAVHFLYIRIMDEAQLRHRFAERGDDQEEVEERIAHCRNWDELAARSSVPFTFLNGADGRDELRKQALELVKKWE